MTGEKGKGVELIVDQKPYKWEKETITGAEIRVLAGVAPGFELWQDVPGPEDIEIADTTVIDLDAKGGPVRLFTVKPDATAG